MLSAVTHATTGVEPTSPAVRCRRVAARAIIVLALGLAPGALAAGSGAYPHLEDAVRLAAFDPVILGLLQDAGSAGTPAGTASEESWLGLEEVDATIYNDLVTDILTQAEIGYNRPGEFRPESRRAFKAGDLLVYPYLQQRFGYNDNIFLEDGEDDGDPATDDDEDEDIYSLTRFGLLGRISFAQGDHNIELGGEASWNQFFDESDDSYFEGTAGAAWNFRSGSVYGKIADRFERREDPIEIALSNDLFRRNINTANGILGVDFDSFNIEGEANWENNDFTDSSFEFLNRDEYWGSIRPGIYLNPDLRLFVEGVYGEREMDDDGGINNSYWVEGSVGVTGEIAEHLSGRVQAGVIHETFDDNGTLDDLDDDHDDAVAVAVVRYEASNDTTVDTSFLRTQQFSVIGNYQVLNRADVTITHVLYPNLLGRVGGFAEHANVSNGNSIYRYGIGVGLKYRITSYLDLDADYSFKDREVVDTPFGDYTNNIVSVGATLQF